MCEQQGQPSLLESYRKEDYSFTIADKNKTIQKDTQKGRKRKDNSLQDREIWEGIILEKGVWAAFGCHPHMAQNYTPAVEKYLKSALLHYKVKALGEIGLDYSSRNNCPIEIQHEVFRKQLQIALQLNLPLVIHCREAHQDCIQIMKEMVPTNYYIHRHCFTGSWEEAKIWLETFPNLYLGLTALVTFPSAREVHEVAKKIPLDRLLLETDAPYFLPRRMPQEKRWSHPGMVIHVAAQIAAMRTDVNVKEVLAAARKNTKRIYDI